MNVDFKVLYCYQVTYLALFFVNYILVLVHFKHTNVN